MNERNPSFKFLQKVDEDFRKKAFRNLVDDVVAGHDSQAIEKADAFIQGAKPTERRHITTSMLIDDLKQMAHDKDERAIRLAKVEGLAMNKFIPNLNYKELSSTSLAKILDDNYENLKKMKGFKRANRFV